jgi:hypothetical protein
MSIANTSTLTLDPDFKALSQEQREQALQALYFLSNQAGSENRPSGRTQIELIHAIGSCLLGVSPELISLNSKFSIETLGSEFLEVPAAIKHRLLQLFLLAELVLDPLPEAVASAVEQIAKSLAIHDEFLSVGRDMSRGAYAIVASDLHRKGYLGDPKNLEKGGKMMRVHKHLMDPFEGDEEDPDLLTQWLNLEQCAAGTLGRTIWEYYQGRGFVFTGQEGSVNPSIAQHDWLHVLADYATTIEGELEVFSFIGSAIPDPSGFSFIVAIVSLFETGRLDQWGGGVLNADKGHLDLPGMPVRLADAIIRGRKCNLDVMYDIDYFSMKDMPLGQVKEFLGIPPKSPEAIQAGSLGIMDPQGITSYQREHGDHKYQPPVE